MARTQTNITNLLSVLENDYPELVFRNGKRFLFRPPKTVVIGSDEENADLLLLHEVGHALSCHRSFDTDIRRLKMEREAWEKARELAKQYGVEFDDEIIETELDSYREWLDKKSRCKKCGLTCYQAQDGKYQSGAQSPVSRRLGLGSVHSGKRYLRQYLSAKFRWHKN